MTATSAITLTEFMKKVTDLQEELNKAAEGTEYFAKSGAPICAQKIYEETLAAEQIDWSILVPEMKELFALNEASLDNQGLERRTGLTRLEAKDIDPASEPHREALLGLVSSTLLDRERRTPRCGK